MRWFLGWCYISSLHSADESQEGRNSCPLLRSSVLYRFMLCLVSQNVFNVLLVWQFIVFKFLFFCFFADQISCRSYVGSVYRMRSLAVSRFSLQIQCSLTSEKSFDSTNHNKFTFTLCLPTLVVVTSTYSNVGILWSSFN